MLLPINGIHSISTHPPPPPCAQPPAVCICFVTMLSMKTVVLCAQVAFIGSFHFTRFAVFWPFFFFSASRLQTIFSRFDEALNSGNMALSPSHGQFILIYLTLWSGFAVVLIWRLLYIWGLCAFACAGAFVWLHLVFLLCLVCCHKPLLRRPNGINGLIFVRVCTCIWMTL